jgi:hypothetical protein
LREGFDGSPLFTQSALDVGTLQVRKLGCEQSAVPMHIVAMNTQASQILVDHDWFLPDVQIQASGCEGAFG